jgi:endoglucanase
MTTLTHRFARGLLAAAATLAFASAHAASVSGGHVYDSAGKRLQLKGINWFGAETADHTVHGLWARNLDDMLGQMQTLGFNAVRLPFCPATVHGAPTNSINTTLNPDLAGLNGQQVFDAVIAKLEKRGMYYLLDHHRPDCAAISELWYTGSYTEAQWIADLQFVADRYKANPHFLGMDLKNEPHGAATWGGSSPATDWNSAAERAAAAVLAKAPDALIFVEGVARDDYCTATSAGAWWGGNVGPQACKPLAIPANRLVLSPHVYGPDVSEQDYFQVPGFPGNMPPIWDAHFGSLAAAGYAVIIGETGGKYGTGDPKDKTFQDALIAYLEQRGMFDMFYWCWNPNSGDTGGILEDDWLSVRTDKMALLQGYWAAGGTPPTPHVVLGAGALAVPEGKSASVAVALSDKPAADVTVKVKKAAGGDADLKASPTSFVFTPANYATPQSLKVKAAQDADQANGSASFKLSAPGFDAATLAATEVDDDHPTDCTLSFDTSNSWSNGEVMSVTLRNDAAVPLVDWRASWTESTDVTLGSTWSATVSQAGRVLTAVPVDFDRSIAPGSSVTFGVTLGFTGAKAMPSGGAVAGHACVVNVAATTRR